MSLSTHTVQVSARHEQSAPNAAVLVTVSNRPDTTLYVGMASSSNGVDHLDFGVASGVVANILIFFQSPAGLAEGTYTDTVTIVVCLDSACAQPIVGAPAFVQVTYTVTRNATITIDDVATVSASITDPAPTATLSVQVQDAPPSDVSMRYDYNTSDYASIVTNSDTATGKDFTITFPSPAARGDGVFEASFTANACSTSLCTQHFAGSPQVVNTVYTVTAPPLPSSGTIALDHDVVHARYSVALDAIVMTSTSPSNALYVLDPVTGTEQQMALPSTPTALALDSAGTHAAVGHGNQVSYLDLATVGAIGAPAPATLHLSVTAHSLVLDGAGYLHALPTDPNVGNKYSRSVHIASDTEAVGAIGYFSLSPVVSAVGVSVYGVDWSSNLIGKYDLSGGVVGYVDVSAITWTACGALFPGVGSRMFSACGHVLNQSASPTDDLDRLGILSLGTTGGRSVRSLSESAAADEIALVRVNNATCGAAGAPPIAAPTVDCLTAVMLFDRTTFARTATYYLPDIERAGVDYPQHGQYIFHRNDGSARIVISRAFGQADPTKAFYVITSP